MSAFDELEELEPLRIWQGVAARSIEGQRVGLAVVELDADSIVPEHSHENEQLGIVLSGSVSFRVGDETRELGPGAAWRIPPNTPHEVLTGPEGAVLIDVFAPAREDWRAVERDEPRPPRWP